jgi:hypothetical protein
MISGLSTNIQNRELCRGHYSNQCWLNSQLAANAQIEQQLDTTSADISLSLSLFILFQGNVPLIWSAISEIKGRKVRSLSRLEDVIRLYRWAQLVYLLSLALFTLGSAIVAVSRSIGLVIGMRIVQAAGYGIFLFPQFIAHFQQVKRSFRHRSCHSGRHIRAPSTRHDDGCLLFCTSARTFHGANHWWCTHPSPRLAGSVLVFSSIGRYIHSGIPLLLQRHFQEGEECNISKRIGKEGPRAIIIRSKGRVAEDFRKGIARVWRTADQFKGC